MVKRTRTSRAWMREHVNDPFVQLARARGFRSRAAFKLEEIDQQERLLRPGQCVVDLGAAPGSWAQYAAQAVGASRSGGDGLVFALDLLPVDPLPGVVVLVGDFTEASVEQALVDQLAGRPVDVVLSDMAPNMSGVGTVDQARSIYLCELALEFARAHLVHDGALLVKAFQGEGFESFRNELGRSFRRVQRVKPKASRDRSPEVFLLGRGLI